MSRRTALKLLGAAGVVGATGTGLSMAKGDSQKDSGLSVKVDWTQTFNEASDGTSIGEITDIERTATDHRQQFAVAGPAGDYRSGEGEESEPGKIWLGKTDADGNLLWDGTYGPDDQSIDFRGMDVTSGGYVVAGSDGKVNFSGGYGYIAKIDENGDVAWKHEEGGVSYGDVVSVNDGVVVVGGTDHGEEVTGSTHQTLIRKYDEDGNKMWEWTGRFEKYTTYNGMTQVVSSDDGGVVALGFAGIHEGRGGRDFGVIKIASDGTEEWRQMDLGGHMWQEVSEIDAIDTLGEDEYVLGGYTAQGEEMGIARLDGDGNVEWTNGYEGPSKNDEELDFLYALARANSGFVAYGSVNNYKNHFADDKDDRTDAEQLFSVDEQSGDVVYEYIFDEGQLPGRGLEMIHTLDDTSDDTLLIGGILTGDKDGAFLTKITASNWDENGGQDDGNQGDDGQTGDGQTGDGQGDDDGQNDSDQSGDGGDNQNDGGGDSDGQDGSGDDTGGSSGSDGSESGDQNDDSENC